jgi:hypothetical protein
MHYLRSEGSKVHSKGSEGSKVHSKGSEGTKAQVGLENALPEK